MDELEDLLNDKDFNPEKIRWSMKMMQSRYESEKRGRNAQGQLINQMQRTMEMQKSSMDIQQETIKRLEEVIKTHQEMLLDRDRGLMFSVRDLQNNEKNSKDTLTRVLAIISILITLGGLIAKYIKL